MKSHGELNTEKRNLVSSNIDSMPIGEILRTINREDSKIINAVNLAIPKIEETIKLTISSIKNGGRVFYVGAGTSGRLGVLDASEIPPTFSAPNDYFNGIIAGGDEALRNSIEGAEDHSDNAIVDLKSYSLNNLDTVIGISCSGAASYVVSALEYARDLNAKTVYLVTNPSPFRKTKVDVTINANTGPEIITGSTRMKAGTATKLALNMISTATMVRLGKVYGNMMVDLMAVNEKLVDRGSRIIQDLTDLKYEECNAMLLSAEMSVKTALVMINKKCTLDEARKRLERHNGILRDIIN